MNLNNVSTFEKDQLLAFFFYTMPMQQREQLMKQLPAAYNAACGDEIVKVVRASDGKEI